LEKTQDSNKKNRQYLSQGLVLMSIKDLPVPKLALVNNLENVAKNWITPWTQDVF